MKLSGLSEGDDDRSRLLVRAMQFVLFGLVVYGAATLQLGMVANGLLALAVTFLPAALRREYGYTMAPGLVLWITVAIFLHSVGSLGLYDQFSWYDEITHTVSATIVAGIGYAALRAFERHSDDIDVPSEFRAVFIVVFVLAFGVIWEVFEFGAVFIAQLLGVSSPVTVYGIDDIVTDMMFNTVGAVLVAVWGTGYFGGLVSFLRRRLESEGG
ncbi:hypothetical protein SAMN04488063_2183 [Halopelagius inordinatus]|uniref:Uncharacterized protein n=2 Tax=Halopelagius inordinatus TaxID=553467 RepID=A0A1I2SB20_9EURY|nr:hypothetical protein [Halopelagius inordinatus]SFG48087.1 hypothetical protein SAMN04488063_2183 [Halopelagius inordinatus]